jgi:hypothetical protein
MLILMNWHSDFFLSLSVILTIEIQTNTKAMKKVLFTLAICVAGLTAVQAQQMSTSTTAAAAAAKTGMPSKEEQVEKMMKTLTSSCQLSPDQVTKVKPIVSEFVKDKMENKQKYGSDKDKLKAANQASFKAMTGKLSGILTPDQQKQFAAKVKEMKEQKEKQQQKK